MIAVKRYKGALFWHLCLWEEELSFPDAHTQFGDHFFLFLTFFPSDWSNLSTVNV